MLLLCVVLGLVMTTAKLLLHKIHVILFLTKERKFNKDEQTQTGAEKCSHYV